MSVVRGNQIFPDKEALEGEAKFPCDDCGFNKNEVCTLDGDCEWVDLKTTLDREAIKELILNRIADYGAGTISILDLPDILADEIMILLEERK